MSNSEERYQLQSTSEGFQNKVKDVFANLDSIADKTEKKKTEENKKQDDKKPRHYQQHDDRRSRERSPPRSKKQQERHYSNEFKGRESIFRTPNESGWPPSRSDDRRRPPRHQQQRRLPPKVPDHVINPNKYTKYDLSDVSKDQLSDRSNTRAAFDFLRNLKDQKTNAEDIADRKDHQEMVQDGKISFKKPIKNRNEEMAAASSSANVVHDGVKRVMPECVVGQKKQKSSDDTTKKSKISTKKQTISLSHLDDEEDEDDN